MILADGVVTQGRARMGLGEAIRELQHVSLDMQH